MTSLAFSPLLQTSKLTKIGRVTSHTFIYDALQDALDLISGRYTISRSGPSPFQLNGFESLSYLPVASALIVGGLTMTTFTLNQGLSICDLPNGKQFCSRPRLCGLL
ncbi:hypothetical protein BHM03_00041168 [Ensete ventricosum]|nr:hypothetical protein BHM03_00041168 [Ensete ventricosum]